MAVLGYYSKSLWASYSLWYIVGTAGALQARSPTAGGGKGGYGDPSRVRCRCPSSASRPSSPWSSSRCSASLPCSRCVRGAAAPAASDLCVQHNDSQLTLPCPPQILALCDEIGRRRGLTWAANFSDMLRIRTTVRATRSPGSRGVPGSTPRTPPTPRAQVAGIIGAAGVAVIAALYPTGYFGPLSVRVRSLFVKHTRTGNPLVDSVAEHQPASAQVRPPRALCPLRPPLRARTHPAPLVCVLLQAYWQHLHYAYFVAPVGLALALVNGLTDDKRRYSGVQACYSREGPQSGRGSPESRLAPRLSSRAGVQVVHHPVRGHRLLLLAAHVASHHPARARLLRPGRHRP